MKRAALLMALGILAAPGRLEAGETRPAMSGPPGTAVRVTLPDTWMFEDESARSVVRFKPRNSAADYRCYAQVGINAEDLSARDVAERHSRNVLSLNPANKVSDIIDTDLGGFYPAVSFSYVWKTKDGHWEKVWEFIAEGVRDTEDIIELHFAAPEKQFPKYEKDFQSIAGKIGLIETPSLHP